MEVLTTNVIVHQVATIHIAKLIGKAIFDISPEGGAVAAPVGPVVGVALAPHARVERSVLVLLALEISLELGKGGWVAFVDRWIGGSADRDDGVWRQSHQEERNAEEQCSERFR